MARSGGTGTDCVPPQDVCAHGFWQPSRGARQRRRIPVVATTGNVLVSRRESMIHTPQTDDGFSCLVGFSVKEHEKPVLDRNMTDRKIGQWLKNGQYELFRRVIRGSLLFFCPKFACPILFIRMIYR